MNIIKVFDIFTSRQIYYFNRGHKVVFSYIKYQEQNSQHNRL